MGTSASSAALWAHTSSVPRRRHGTATAICRGNSEFASIGSRWSIGSTTTSNGSDRSAEMNRLSHEVADQHDEQGGGELGHEGGHIRPGVLDAALEVNGKDHGLLLRVGPSAGRTRV